MVSQPIALFDHPHTPLLSLLDRGSALAKIPPQIQLKLKKVHMLLNPHFQS
jgi:hypothetical protein